MKKICREELQLGLSIYTGEHKPEDLAAVEIQRQSGDFFIRKIAVLCDRLVISAVESGGFESQFFRPVDVTVDGIESQITYRGESQNGFTVGEDRLSEIEVRPIYLENKMIENEKPTLVRSVLLICE